MALRDIMDHGGPDPIQGFDVEVWVQDPSTMQTNGGNAIPSNTSGPENGGLVLLGSFTSIVITIRNATEAYMELNQRMPRYLDGEVQIAWVMERGMIDLYTMKQTFGFESMVRSQRFNRSPRFTITFQMNTAGELRDTGIVTPNGGVFNQIPARKTSGRFVLSHCKVDSFHMASTAGKQVVANQWQGVCEGITTIPTIYEQSEQANVANTSVPQNT